MNEMKILETASYIYNPELEEFTKNKTGYGIVINNLIASLSKTDNEVYFYSHVITKKKVFNSCNFLDHTWKDIILNIRLPYLLQAIKYFFCYKQSFRMRLRYIYYQLNGGLFEKMIRSIKPDIVHIHGCTQPFHSFIKACERTNTKYIVTLHGLIGLNDSIRCSEFEKQAEKDFFKKAELRKIPITVISSGIKEKAVEAYSLKYTDNICVIPNGTSVVDDISNKGLVTDIKEKYELPKDSNLVISVGRICYNKNQIQIVRAFADVLKKRKEEICLFLVGSIDPGYPIEEEIDKFGLRSHIKCLGFMNETDLKHLYSVADLNVQFSLEEGFGLPIIEGFQFGLPSVLCRKIDSFKDVFNQEAVIAVNDYDDSLLSDAIREGLTRKWNREYIANYGKIFIIENMTREYLEEFNNVIR